MKTTYTPELIFEMLGKLAVSQARTDEQLAKTDAQLAKTDAQLAKTDAQLAKTDIKLKNLSEMLGGIANSQGDVAEEYFFNSLEANPKIGSVKFDQVVRNFCVADSATGQRYEYDTVLTNGSAIAILETKYKANERALEQLEKVVLTIRHAMPLYKNHKVYAGIASFAIDSRLKQQAEEKGFFVLERVGDSIVQNADKMRAF